jgi:hypothetical protein
MCKKTPTMARRTVETEIAVDDRRDDMATTYVLRPDTEEDDRRRSQPDEEEEDSHPTETDTDEKYRIWQRCVANVFRPSTEDLLSDYVDPVAELHMTLPPTLSPNKNSVHYMVSNDDHSEVECFLELPKDHHVTRVEQKVMTKQVQRQVQRLLLHRFARV